MSSGRSEETEALTKLVRKKESLEDIAAQTGLSVSTIKRRLALNGLSDEVSAALADEELTLLQAEAPTRVGSAADWDASDGTAEERADHR